MKELIHTPSFQSKVEFWAATTVFVFGVLFVVSGDDNSNIALFTQEGLPFHYFENYVFPQLVQALVLYVTFLFLNFRVIPEIIAKERLPQNFVLVVLAFVLVGLVFGVTSTYYQEFYLARYATEEQAYSHIFSNSFRHTFWLFLMLALYSFIKHVSFYLLSNSEAIQSKYKLISRDGLAAFVVYMVSMFLLMAAGAEGEFILGWGLVAPFGIFLYCLSFYYLIPKSLPAKRPLLSYVGRVLLLLVLAFVPVALIIVLFLHDEGDGFGFSFFNSVFQLMITVPFTWVMFKRHLKGKEELYVLQKELGTSNANLDFLRSQINPHFLFNALNTLYGTALQESSERTAQGIQMLGDMMRFMLHENMQQKILLSREIEYMRNYIDLQKLRTSNSPDIIIQTKIEEVVDDKFIAPMLLIPFVENAFKHGISLKNASWIKISLHSDKNKLYFDVYNSSHVKLESDPEKDQSGIGLANVKQRLAALYPNRHELIIRDTPEEYFVHLTITL